MASISIMLDLIGRDMTGSAFGSALLSLARLSRVGNSLPGFQKQTQQMQMYEGAILGAAAAFGLFDNATKLAIDAGAQLQMATTMASIAISDGATHVNELETAIVNLANNSQYKIADVDLAFRVLGGLGFTTDQIIKTLGPDAIALGQALGVQAADGAQLLGQAFYLFNNQGISAAHMADILTGAFYNNMMSVSQLTQFIGMAGGTADAAGVSFQSLMTFGSMLTPMFGSASSAGASLAYLMRNVMTPATDKQREEIKKLGLQVWDSKGNFVGLQSIMDQLLTKMQGMSTHDKMDIIGQMFNVRSGRAAMDLMSETRSQFDATYARIFGRLGQVNQAQNDATKINETAQGAWNRLTTTANDFMARAGVLINQFLVPVYDWFNKLFSTLQNNAVVEQFFAAFLVGGTILSGVTVVGVALGAAFAFFGPIVGIAIAVFAALVLMAGEVAAVFTILTTHGNLFSGQLAFLNPLIQTTRDLFSALWADISKQNWGPLLTVAKGLGIVLAALAGIIAGVLISSVLAFALAILGVVDLAGRFSSWIGHVMGELHVLGNVFSDVGILIKDVFTGNWGALKGDVERIQRDWNNDMRTLAAQQAMDMKKQAEQEAIDAKKAALEKTAAEYDTAAKGDENLRKQAQQQADFYTAEAKNTKDAKLKAQLEQNAAMYQAQANGYKNDEAQATAAAANLRGQAKDLQTALTTIQQTTTQQVGGSFVQMSSKEVTEAKGARGKVAAEMQGMKQDAIIQASQMESGVVTQWTLLGNNAYTWGQHAGNNFAGGLLAAKSSVSTAAQELAAQAAATLEHSKPKEGPLKDDDVWGYHLAQNFANGMLQGTSLVGAAATHLAGTVSGRFNTPLAAQGAAAPLVRGGGGGQQIVIPLYIGSKQVAQVVYDTLKGTLQQNGMSRNLR